MNQRLCVFYDFTKLAIKMKREKKWNEKMKNHNENGEIKYQIES